MKSGCVSDSDKSALLSGVVVIVIVLSDFGLIPILKEKCPKNETLT